MAKRLFTVEANTQSIDGMYRLAENVAKYPNRINRAKTIATELTKTQFKTQLTKNYGKSRKRSYMYADDRVLPVTVRHTRNRSVLEIRILKAVVQGNNTIDEKDLVNRARMDIQIKMYGRRSYTSKRRGQPGEKWYKLRMNNPHAKYKIIDPIPFFKVSAQSRDENFYRFMREQPSKLMKKNLKEQLAIEGFGPRGGVSGITTDISRSQVNDPNAKYIRPDMR